MDDRNPMATISCGPQLAELDERYERARKTFLTARERRDNDLSSILRELIALRREMLSLETAEAERVYARHREADHAACL